MSLYDVAAVNALGQSFKIHELSAPQNAIRHQMSKQKAKKDNNEFISGCKS